MRVINHWCEWAKRHLFWGIPTMSSLHRSPTSHARPSLPAQIPTCCFHSLLKFQPALHVLEGSPPLAHCCHCPCPILGFPILSLQSSLPSALQLCLSLSDAWRRAWVWTAASPDSCCLWGPPSTWMAPRSMRPWQPSLLLKSTTMSWTLVRSPQSGETMMLVAGKDRGCVYKFPVYSCISFLSYIIMYMHISQNLK